tara:strand:- start:43 stop:762 length:720 start_codon:yes stop_codon:yes gene_type:complete
MEISRTLYKWCLINNICPLDIKNQDEYMLNDISYDEFNQFLSIGNFKKGEIPIKPEKYLELRMYGLVPYNILGIQKGIQFGHSIDEMSLEQIEKILNGESIDSRFLRWLRNWKTYIILNGGTSNEGHMISHGLTEKMYFGSMQQHLKDLEINGVYVTKFYEPDLNSTLSAINFIVDERVWDKKKYKNFTFHKIISEDATPTEIATWFKEKNESYKKWVNKIGGPQNEFLRDFLVGKKLA